jgi:hypothetical protein
VINQLEWEAIALIQDSVLQDYSRVLYWGNRATMRATRFLGQRILMQARDTAWKQTTLLAHGRDDEELALVEQLIDAYAASIADLVHAVTANPTVLVANTVAWMRRGERISPQLQTDLLCMATRSPVIADLIMEELAFGGADPVGIVVQLLTMGQHRLAGVFGRSVLERAPRRQRQRFVAFARRGTQRSADVIEAMLYSGAKLQPLQAAMNARPAFEIMRLRWRARLDGDLACLKSSTVGSPLALALGEDARRVRAKLHGVGDMNRNLETPPTFDADQAQAFLAAHPQQWVRVCAEEHGEGELMTSMIERVLFLKETSVFMEVDVSVLVHVARNLRERDLRAGEAVVTQGEHVPALVLIADGTAEVTQSRDGGPVRIAVLGPHDPVGELSALNGTPATADCTAVTALHFYELPNEVLVDLLHEHPRLAIGMMRMLSQKLMSTTLKVHGHLPSC